VRELQNVIERSVIVSDTDEFTVDESWLSPESPRLRIGLSSSLAAQEKTIVEDALRVAAGEYSGPEEQRPDSASPVPRLNRRSARSDRQEPFSHARDEELVTPLNCRYPTIGEPSPIKQLSTLLDSTTYTGPEIASCVRHENSIRVSDVLALLPSAPVAAQSVQVGPRLTNGDGRTAAVSGSGRLADVSPYV